MGRVADCAGFQPGCAARLVRAGMHRLWSDASSRTENEEGVFRGGRDGMSNVTVAESATRPAEQVEQQTRLLPPYRVILHNDDVNTFEHVIQAILKLTPLKEPEAVKCTIEAHETGVSLLLVTHRERAELYVEQFASLSLTVTCERDE
jgi:ATP-dependent Clp protease adaptor protein ClpS